MDGGLETLLRRDRRIVLAALAVIVALAWIYLIRLGMAPAPTTESTRMAGMDMSGMTMAGMNMAPGARTGFLQPALTPWSASDFLLMLLMWAVMMVGMMTPSAAPIILLYARVARSAEAKGKPFISTAWFTAGYLLAWSGFALLATAMQWALASAALLTPMMASASPRLGGLLLIAAGVYQWTPLKYACLSQCQSPLQFIQRHGGFRGDASGAIRLGLSHGLYCIGCCWALMLLLFVVGVMNLLWIAALAVIVLTEKLLPAGQALPRVIGAALILAGLAMAMGFI